MGGDNAAYFIAMKRDIALIKKRTPLPLLMDWLGLGNFAKPSTRCPFHQDARASFSIYETVNGWRWKCHASCGGGDEVAFIERAENLSTTEAISRLWQLSGYSSPDFPVSSAIKAPAMAFPPDLHCGSRDELERVAALRNVDFWAVATMQQNGVLRFGTVCSSDCWIVTDASSICAEARRMDGAPFPASGPLPERKAHTLAGAKKNWPVGISLPRDLTHAFRKILLLEGSGDLVAGYHFALAGPADWLPVAILGASVRGLNPAALALMKGKRVRIVPHCDVAGRKAAESWAAEIAQAGCQVDGFSLEGLRKRDGTLLDDLNDATDISAEDAAQMEGLLE